jgi:hypothetical protein
LVEAVVTVDKKGESTQDLFFRYRNGCKPRFLQGVDILLAAGGKVSSGFKELDLRGNRARFRIDDRDGVVFEVRGDERLAVAADVKPCNHGTGRDPFCSGSLQQTAIVFRNGSGLIGVVAKQDKWCVRDKFVAFAAIDINTIALGLSQFASLPSFLAHASNRLKHY